MTTLNAHYPTMIIVGQLLMGQYIQVEREALFIPCFATLYIWDS
jgi:hypothetical protein